MSEEPNVSSSVTEEGILQQLVHSRPLTLANDARLQYLVEESVGKTQYLSSEDVWRESTEQEALKQEEQEQAQASGLDCNAPMPLDIVSDVSHSLPPNCCQVAQSTAIPSGSLLILLSSRPTNCRTITALLLFSQCLATVMIGLVWTCGLD